MIEILILYIIRKHEKTLYSVRKEIIDIFGAYTRPSIGTVYPAIRRLLKMGAVSLTERYSEGGKKSSYYTVTPKGLECFRKMFFANASDNPSLFYTQLQIRIGVMSLLSIEDRKKFIKETLRILDTYKYEIENKLQDEFLELDSYQQLITKRTFNDIVSLLEFVKNLKVDNDG